MTNDSVLLMYTPALMPLPHQDISKLGFQPMKGEVYSQEGQRVNQYEERCIAFWRRYTQSTRLYEMVVQVWQSEVLLGQYLVVLRRMVLCGVTMHLTRAHFKYLKDWVLASFMSTVNEASLDNTCWDMAVEMGKAYCLPLQRTIVERDERRALERLAAVHGFDKLVDLDPNSYLWVDSDDEDGEEDNGEGDFTNE